MPVYQYTCYDKEGEKKTKRAEANSERELEGYLLEEGLFVIDMKLADRLEPTGSQLKAKAKAKAKTKTKTKTKIKRRDLIEFCIFLGMMTESGVGLTTALSDFSSESTQEELASVVNDLYQNVISGESLSSAMKKYEAVFTEEFVELIYAGERTGTLSRSFKELANYLEWQEKTATEIRQATLYPKVVSGVLGIFLLYLFSAVVPGIAEVLIKMKVPLPTITKVVLAISDFAVQTWWAWILLFFGAPWTFKFLIRKKPRMAYQWDDFKLKLPLVGELLNLIIQARFVQNFGIIHRAGIPIIENLELCSRFIGSKVYGVAITGITKDIRDGIGLTDAMKSTGLFSGLILRMINLGESTGQLDNSLLHASDYYNRELPRRIKKIFGILEPVLILTLVGVVGIVALAIFLPILSISGNLR